MKFHIPEVVDLSLLEPNDYNPNSMPHKEMKLLMQCIKTYGFLFPILVNKENDKYVIIDGYHRYETLRRMNSDKALIVNLDISIEERMQLTVLMNRIKGMHGIESMSSLVIKLTGLGVPSATICKNLGITAEEYIRLSNQLGFAAEFSNCEYSKEWTS